MRQRDGVQQQPLRRPREKLMAQLARGHLHRPAACLHQRLHVPAFHHAFQSHPPRHSRHEPRIPIAGRTAQAMVEVRHHQPPASLRRERVQHAQQDHRVNAARHRYQHTRARREQRVLAEAGVHLGDEGLHATMLRRKRGFTSVCRTAARQYFSLTEAWRPWFSSIKHANPTHGSLLVWRRKLHQQYQHR